MRVLLKFTIPVEAHNVNAITGSLADEVSRELVKFLGRGAARQAASSS